MNNRRLHAILVLLQLLGLLLLTQPWFNISMSLNGKPTSLGEYDATAAYSIAMPATLLAGAAVLVALLLTNLPRRLTLGFNAVVLSASVFWIGAQVMSKNVAGLDGQLDRLTGIANTHGAAGLSTEVSLFPWLWIVGTILAVLVCGYLAINKAGWIKPTTTDSKSKKMKLPVSPIELWEQQRD